MKNGLIFRILLVFLFSVIFYYSAGINSAQASEVICADNSTYKGSSFDFTFDPANPTTNDTSLKVTIDAKGLMAPGTYGVIAPIDGKTSISTPIYPITFNAPEGSRQIASVTIPKDSNFGFKKEKYYISLINASSGFLTAGVKYLCKNPNPLVIINPGDPLPQPPGEDSCDINMWRDLKPSNPFSFKVDGLANEGTKRGVVVRNIETGKETNTCKTNEELKAGVEFNKIGGEPLIVGAYHVEIGEKCTLIDTNDGPLLCNTVLNVALDGGNEGCSDPKQCEKVGETCLPDGQCGPKEDYDWGKTQLACDDLEFDPTVGNGGEMVHTGLFKCKTAIGPINTNPNDFMQKVLQLIMGLAGGILLILIIINGYKFMVSQGDPEKIKEAREGIIAAIAGILMIIFSLSLLRLITSDILGIPGFR